MKTVGIAMLFGLCTLIGFRIAAKITARLHTVRTLREELRVFAERAAAGQGTLKNAADGPGMFSRMIAVYLGSLSDGVSEREASVLTVRELKKDSAEQTAARGFFDGLSTASRADLLKRTESFSHALDRAEQEAEAGSAQARVIRASGALIGAGLAILLL